MKKKLLILIVFLLLLAAGTVPFWGTVHKTDASVQSEVQTEATAEPVYVSDPIYGDDITQEELETLREEDAAEVPGSTGGIVIGEEFSIELNENQGTDGF